MILDKIKEKAKEAENWIKNTPEAEYLLAGGLIVIYGFTGVMIGERIGRRNAENEVNALLDAYTKGVKDGMQSK